MYPTFNNPSYKYGNPQKVGESAPPGNDYQVTTSPTKSLVSDFSRPDSQLYQIDYSKGKVRKTINGDLLCPTCQKGSHLEDIILDDLDTSGQIMS